MDNGYVECACRDCFNLAIGRQGKTMCHDCRAAGCERDAECSRSDAYLDAMDHDSDNVYLGRF